MAAPTIPLKRGDTFDLSSVSLTADGVAVNMTGWSVLSQVRTSAGELVQTLDFAWVDQTEGVFSLASNVTATWPVGLLNSDIQYTLPGGTVRSTVTFHIDCLRDESR